MSDDLKAQIAARFRRDDWRRIEVPEWGTMAELDDEGKVKTPAQSKVVTYKPVTLNDQSFVFDAGTGDRFRMAAHLVALKAHDEEGKRLFSQIDATFLMENEDPILLMRLSIQMTGRLTIEDAEKN